MEPFPYEVSDIRKILGEPFLYKSWTIWHYKIYCQQTGSIRGEWRELTLAVKNGAVIVGCVYQLIDEIKES